MNGLPLSRQLLGGLGSMQPPQQAQGAQSPMQMSAQSSAQGSSADFMDSTVLPSIAEQMRAAQSMILPLMQRSASLQGGYEDEAQKMWERLQGTLAPKEYGTQDVISSMARGVQGGGASVGGMLMGAAGAIGEDRKRFEANEAAKAEMLHRLAQQRADTNEKRMFDLFGKAQQLGKQQGMEFRTLADGTVAVFDRSQGIPVGVYGPQQISKIADLTKTLAQQAMDKGQYASLEEATQWATQEALRMVSQMNQGTGNRVSPLQGGETQLLPTPAGRGAPSAPSQPWSPAQIASGGERVTPNDLEAYEILRSEIAEASKQNNTEVVRALQREMLARFPQGKPTGAAMAEPPRVGMPKKDIPLAKMEEAQAGDVGKNLQKEADTIRAAASASSDLIGQLKQLEAVYANPDIPEGRFGEATQDVRSALVSLGFLDESQKNIVGAADLARAISGKLALQMRTAGGSNLMPGAMSDFEQRILRSLAPGLGSTAEGRQALIQSMMGFANANIRMAQELEKMTDDRGLVSPEWYKRRQRLEKEERARIAMEARQLQQRFGGGK